MSMSLVKTLNVQLYWGIDTYKESEVYGNACSMREDLRVTTQSSDK
jgi:hypothetical protein